MTSRAALPEFKALTLLARALLPETAAYKPDEIELLETCWLATDVETAALPEAKATAEAEIEATPELKAVEAKVKLAFPEA
jgi:hypothetical protein